MGPVALLLAFRASAGALTPMVRDAHPADVQALPPSRRPQARVGALGVVRLRVP